MHASCYTPSPPPAGTSHAQACSVLADCGALLPARLAPNDLAAVLWCPVPPRAPLPPRSTLEWAPNGRDLQLRSVCLAVQLVAATRTSCVEEVVAAAPPPSPKGKKKKKAGPVGGLPPPRR